MRVCTLDLSSSTGWALGSIREGVLGYGVQKLPSSGEDVGRFLDVFDRWLGALIEEKNPGEIVFESPVMPAKTTITTCRKLYGLAGHTELIARRYGVACFESNLSSIRSHFIGTSRAPGHMTKAERRPWFKRQAVLQCRSRGFHVAGDDEAEALALLSLRLSQHQSGYDMRAPAARAA